MAVVGVAKEVPFTRTSNYDGGIRTCSITQLVKTDAKTDRENVVGAAPGVPGYGDPHPGFAVAYAVTQSITEHSETPLAWLVVTNYTSKRTLDPNPLDDEVLVDWNSEIYQEVVQFDIDGNAVLNSAGDYFIDPTPTRDAIHLIAKIQANVASVPAWVITYQNAVNNASVTIGGLVCAAGLVKIQRITIGTREERGGVMFYKFSYEAHIHKEGWRLKPLDAGFRYLTYEGVPIPIKLDAEGAVSTSGDEVTTPVPLDGSGGMLVSPSPATGVFGNFKIYDELDLTVLPGIS
jgi:hypothetical protein